MNIVEKINNELKGLSIVEKLDYWYSEVYPNTTDEEGYYHIPKSESYFGTKELIGSKLGYMPIVIYKNHLGDYLENNMDYVIYMASRKANYEFQYQKPKIYNNYKINGEDYLLKWKETFKNKGRENITEPEIFMGDKGIKELSEKYLYRDYLFPFVETLLTSNNDEVKQPDCDTPIKLKTTLCDLVNDLKRMFILSALEDLSITKDGVCILSERKISSLRGFVEALTEKSILPQRNRDDLIEIIASEIKLNLKARLKDSSNSAKMKKQTIDYINIHHY